LLPKSKNKEKYSVFLEQNPTNEEFMAKFSDDPNKRNNAEETRLMTEFFKINRRITYAFCIPLIKKLDSIYYCGFAKIPGRWLASCVRYEIIDRKELQPTKDTYNKQQHVIHSCMQQLLHSEFENYLGKCRYSVTKYERLLRFSIPHKRDFMILLNAYPDKFEDFTKAVVDPFISLIMKEKKDLIDSCEKQEKIMKEMKFENIVPNFFNTKNSDLVNLLKKFYSNDERVQYASIGGYKNLPLPLARYKKAKNLLLKPYDEFEYLIQSIEGLKLRNEFTRFFGNIEFFLSVYEKRTTLVIPFDERFFALIALKDKMHDEKIPDDEKNYSPSTKAIFDFIKAQDMKYITTGLSMNS